MEALLDELSSFTAHPSAGGVEHPSAPLLTAVEWLRPIKAHSRWVAQVRTSARCVDGDVLGPAGHPIGLELLGFACVDGESGLIEGESMMCRG